MCEGEWTLANLGELAKEVHAIQLPSGSLTVQGEAITKMDSAGAWLLSQELEKFSTDKNSYKLVGFHEQHQKLLALIESHDAASTPVPSRNVLKPLAKVGKFTVDLLQEFRDFLAFTGQLAMEGLRLCAHPKRFRWSALVSVIDVAGFRALPIIALLSFMIGIVMAYQMGLQLRNYGANIYIVDFIGLSIMREFGPLLTAIMVSGRTGSAFTAQLGTMKINQEVDALNTMGVTPAELLLLPRVIGLVIALPLLTIWSDIFGVLGGMVMAHSMLNITPYDFVMRFGHVIPVKTLLIGLGKAPVFALLIAAIGCFEGMRVHGSADSVGRQTTRSVVLAIFFIIVTDAIFSILFSKLNL